MRQLPIIWQRNQPHGISINMAMPTQMKNAAQAMLSIRCADALADDPSLKAGCMLFIIPAPDRDQTD